MSAQALTRAIAVVGNRVLAILVSLQTFGGIILAFLFPSVVGSVRSAAAAEVARLRRRNRWERREPFGAIHRLVGFLDSAKVWLGLLIAAGLGANLYLANVNWVWVRFVPWDMKAYVETGFTSLQACPSGMSTCPNADNYHALLGGMQATVLGLLIPIAIAAYELVLKDRHLKDEMQDFVMREARVDLITRSSIFFLMWLGLVELLKVNVPGLRLGRFVNYLEYAWVSVNLLLVAYFMSRVMGLVNRFNFSRAMRRFILRMAYPRDLRERIADIRYRSLTRYGRDQL